jgi:hypothetical protein
MIGLVNIWSTTRKIVSTIVGGGGNWIGSGPNGPSGTSCICWTFIVRLENNKGGILACSQKGTIFVASFNIRLGCTFKDFKDGVWSKSGVMLRIYTG